MGFDYSWTCPCIDREMDNARETISSFIVDLLDEACPLLSSETRNAIADDYTNALYEQLEACFETTRMSNKDMRETAEEQIIGLENDIENLESEVKNKNDEIESLEDEITQMESEMGPV